MKRCPLCGAGFGFGENRVKVCRGKWPRRKRAEFHFKCFLGDREAAVKAMNELWK